MITFGIAGLGGIGSNAAMHLVREGVISLVIADYDRVEKSNLERQFYFFDQIGLLKTDALEINLKRINSDVVIHKVHEIINHQNVEEIFFNCQCVIEGFDLASNKTMLINELANTGKIIISSNGVAGHFLGNISVRNIAENVYVVGDGTEFPDSKNFCSTKVGTVAASMANLALGKSHM